MRFLVRWVLDFCQSDGVRVWISFFVGCEKRFLFGNSWEWVFLMVEVTWVCCWFFVLSVWISYNWVFFFLLWKQLIAVSVGRCLFGKIWYWVLLIRSGWSSWNICMVERNAIELLRAFIYWYAIWVYIAWNRSVDEDLCCYSTAKLVL